MLPTSPRFPRLPRARLPVRPQAAPPSLVAADFFDPAVARGYAAWLTERLPKGGRLTMRDRRTRWYLLFLANECER